MWRSAHQNMSLWPNWIRRLTTNQKIGGSSPSRDTFLVFESDNQSATENGTSFTLRAGHWSSGMILL